MKHLYLFFSWFLLLLASYAHAGELSITPTQLYLTQQDPIGILNITNHGAEPVVLQLSLKQWSQQGNENYFQETSDLFVTPPLFTLPPGKTQLIRVAMTTHAELNQEKPYRLFLQEVIPQVKTPLSPKQDQLMIALRINLPVIIKPIQPSQPHLQWKTLVSDNNQLTITAKNDGNEVVFVNQLQAFNQKQQPITDLISTFAYILPHNTYHWQATRNNKGTAHAVGAMVNRTYLIEPIS